MFWYIQLHVFDLNPATLKQRSHYAWRIEHAASCLQLAAPSTIILSQKRSFSKAFVQLEEFENIGFEFLYELETFWKKELLENNGVEKMMGIPQRSFPRIQTKTYR